MPLLRAWTEPGNRPRPMRPRLPTLRLLIRQRPDPTATQANGKSSRMIRVCAQLATSFARTAPLTTCAPNAMNSASATLALTKATASHAALTNPITVKPPTLAGPATTKPLSFAAPTAKSVESCTWKKGMGNSSANPNSNANAPPTPPRAKAKTKARKVRKGNQAKANPALPPLGCWIPPLQRLQAERVHPL